MGREPLDYLLLPVRVILHGDFGYARFDGRLNPAWIVLLPLAVAGAWRDGRSRRLLSMCGVFFVLWAITAQQMRFLIPVLPLLAASAARGAVVALHALPGRLRAVSASLATLGALALALALFQSSAVYLRQSPRLVRDYAAHGARLHQMVRHPVYGWIDDRLPADAKLLLLGTNRGFFVPRHYLADSFFEASQVGAFFATARDGQEAANRLREMGVTHLLVDRGGIRVPYPPAIMELVQQGRHAPLLHASADGRFEVREVAAATGR
jgi:hypothetical protein